MKFNRAGLMAKEDLIYHVNDCEKTTKLSRKFPLFQKFKENPHKFVPNDAHIKVTAPGYARNDYGKPFFS